ncbi:hypothetical protein HNQ60_000531 [Povalibacter uvarum]|uniref:Exopolysaccharide biosynthesis protein n=1 Tax=Povalibacter uvarum TaxID=732238 RepID=A0A841HHZ2_9GAMM|nr:exopolysaccharide biosynthesis protein [Povalibacter uvarum]MBB6091685.1 hypothetical protein [Povalibacter uvarum]
MTWRKERVRHKPLSETLSEMAADSTEPRISLRHFMDRAGDRAFGALLFILAFPNIVPTPPGTSAVLGLPMLLLAGQLAWGRRTPWLPRFIAERSLDRGIFAHAVERIAPALRRFERFLKPRAAWLVSPLPERMIGLVTFVLALVIFLPIPLGNIVPAIAICIISLGLLEHDGIAAAVGATLGIAALFLLWGAILVSIRVIVRVIESIGLV